MMASLFSLFIIEMWMNNKMGGHSHGGARGFETHPTSAGVMTASPPRPQRFSGRSSFETDAVNYEKKMAQKMYDGKNVTQQQQASLANAGADLDMPPSEMPPWFIVFYEQYIRQRLEMMNMIKSYAAQQGPSERKEEIMVSEKPMWDEEGQPVDPLVYKKMSSK
jgi:solute carrier family 39 (zinc transporter), member 1/2/3